MAPAFGSSSERIEKYVLDFLRRILPYEGFLMRAQLDQPLGGQGLQGLTNGDPADLEALRDLILAELLPEAQRAEQNLPAKCVVDDL